MNDEAFASLSDVELDQIDAVCSRFEAAWRGGSAIGIEECLTDVASELASGLLRELLTLDIEWRTKSGQRPEPTEYLARFADQAEVVRSVFAEALLKPADVVDLATPAPNEFDPTVVYEAGSVRGMHSKINAPISQNALASGSDVAGDSEPDASAFRLMGSKQISDPLTQQLNESFTVEPPPELCPWTIPGYSFRRVLGQGGMGFVVQAWDEKLHRDVAIKLLQPKFASDEKARQRFLREARASAAIRHPNVVAIYAVEDSHEPPFLVLELVEGTTLADKLKATPLLPLDETLRIAIDLAAGLAAAHAKGIIHRDIKPGNVLIEAIDGRARLTDFGLARAVKQDGMTTTGSIAGTPQFMSPEQIEGRDLDPRSDLFSLGAVLYRMVSGEPAFNGESIITLARQICDHPARPISDIRPDTPAWLRDIIERLLAKRPDDRIPSADELVRLLKQGERRVGEAPAEPQAAGNDGSTRSSNSKRWIIGAAITVTLLVFSVSRPWWKQRELDTNRDSEIERNGASHRLSARRSSEPRPAASAVPLIANLLSADWEWSEPEHLGAAVNSAQGESSPSLTTDGLMLAFISRRTGTPLPYLAQRKSLDAPFNDAEPLAIDLSNWNVVRDVALSGDGLTLAIALGSDMTHLDLYQATRADRQSPWSKSTPLTNVNSSEIENSPKFSADGLRLVFHSNRPPCVGQYDLWEASRPSAADPFGEPQPLAAPISSSIAEENPILTSDNLGLFFTRDWTTPRLHFATRPAVDEPFGEPVPVRIPGIEGAITARAPTLTADGSQMIFGTNRSDGLGDSDLWLTRRVRQGDGIRRSGPDPTGFALAFDGQSSHVRVPTLSRNDPGPLTIEAWVRAKPPTNVEAKVIAVLSGQFGAQITWDSSTFYVKEAMTQATTRSLPVEFDQWVHVALVVDDRETRLYGNGVRRERLPRTTAQLNAPYKFDGLWLGAHPTQENKIFWHFAGELDEIRISKTARYLENFKPQSRFEPDANTLALYHCDDGEGSKLLDSSGNDHHGEIVSAKFTRPDPRVAAANEPIAPQQAAPQTPFEWLTSPDYVWSEPENLGATINGPSDESYPSLMSDQRRLFFCSERGEGGTHFEAVRSAVAEPFGRPTRSKSSLRNPSLSPDGLMLLGTTLGPENYDLQIRHRKSCDAPWSEPISLGPEINSPASDSWPCLSPDGLTLTFASDRVLENKFDVWMSRRPSLTEPFGPAVNAGSAVNTHGYERRGQLLSDGQTLVFNRNTVWCVALMSPKDQKKSVVLPDVPFKDASESWFAPDGRTVYFSEVRAGGFGGKDIWLSRRVRRDRPPPTTTTTPPLPQAKPPFDVRQAQTHQEGLGQASRLLQASGKGDR